MRFRWNSKRLLLWYKCMWMAKYVCTSKREILGNKRTCSEQTGVFQHHTTIIFPCVLFHRPKKSNVPWNKFFTVIHISGLYFTYCETKYSGIGWLQNDSVNIVFINDEWIHKKASKTYGQVQFSKSKLSFTRFNSNVSIYTFYEIGHTNICVSSLKRRNLRWWLQYKSCNNKFRFPRKD